MGSRPSATELRRATRALVYAFLAVFLVCGLARIEAWPFSGWRLFSQSRERVQQGWLVAVADPGGEEALMRWDRLGAGYQGWVHVAGGFGRLDPGTQARVCDAYLDAGRRSTLPAATVVRIYRTTRDLGARAGDAGRPPARTLAFECDASGARAVEPS